MKRKKVEPAAEPAPAEAELLQPAPIAVLEKIGRAREKALELAADHVETVMNALAREAQKGNVPAARLILEVLGTVKRAGMVVAVQQNVAPVPVPTLGDIINIDEIYSNAPNPVNKGVDR